MKFTLDKKHTKLILIISIPVLIIMQYYLFKFGIFRPMVRGIELNISEGDYIEEIDTFVMKLDEEVFLSGGDYIYIPSYSKKPNIWFNVLDDKEIVKIEDSNKLVALKEGISSVAIMKNSRAIRKVNVKVVNPKVEKLIAKSDNELDYVGDRAVINTVIEVDYDGFKEKEKATYESSNNEVIKVSGNKLEAVGVGHAIVTVKAQNEKQEFEYNISAKVSKIEIEKSIVIKEGELKKLNPNIITSPKGLKPPKVQYELISSNLPVQLALTLNEKNGTIKGIREGKEKIRITCGGKSTVVTVSVVKDPTIQDKIQSLKYSYEIVENKVQITLIWDYIENIFDYEVYLKNNSLGDSKHKLVDKVKVKQEDIGESKKIKTVIEVELIDGDIPDLNIYVVGKGKDGVTVPSNAITIKPQKQDIQNMIVKNLYINLNEESRTVRFGWDDIGVEGAQYSIYVKNNLLSDSGYELFESNISNNEYTMNLDQGDLDLQFYVKAHKGDKYSKESNTVNIKINDNDNDDNDNEDSGEEDTDDDSGNNEEDNDQDTSNESE
ncbi:MAG: hypothetical protein ACRC3Y_19225 [Romboutsia sp.]|uniref:hypothetical protein n=1 Tax=Romboutsia sp. TaxID=1965302 RepID=UPI003F3F1273